MAAPFSELLLASSPNGGGLCALSGDQAHVIDRRDCTGLWAGAGTLFCNAIDTLGSGHMQLEAYSRDGKRVLVADPGYDFHDVRELDGNIHLVCTGTNEILTLAPDGRELRRFAFPSRGDTWHLNCLDVWDGRLVVSAFGEFDAPRGYKGNSRGRGFVMDVESRRKLWEGLSQPHTPLQHGGAYYVCNSEERSVLVRGPGGDRRLECDGYTRGLAFGNEYLYVGLSQSRNAESGPAARARIIAVDPVRLEIRGERELPFREVYDIRVLRDPEPLIFLAQERVELTAELGARRRQVAALEAALLRLDRHAVAGTLLKLLRWIKRDPTFGRSR